MIDEIITQIFEMTAADTDEYTVEFLEVLNLIRGEVDYSVSEKLYSAVMMAVYEAKQAGFKAGWQMRGQL